MNMTPEELFYEAVKGCAIIVVVMIVVVALAARLVEALA